MHTWLLVGAVIDLDVTYFFQLALFLLLLVTLNWLMFRPMLGILEKRRTATDEREREAVRQEREAAELTSAYAREMGQATAAGMQVRNRLREEALREEAEQLGHAREQAARWLEAGVAEYRREVESARQAAKPMVDGAATEIVALLTRGTDGQNKGGRP